MNMTSEKYATSVDLREVSLPPHLYRLNPHYMFLRKNHTMETSRIPNSKHVSKRQKNRLTEDQLRILEDSFFQMQKLEPERKYQLANKLGMPAQQVSIWYQNRRVRWKNQNIELDYRTLQLRLDSVVEENTRLHTEVRQLRDELQNAQEMLSICTAPFSSYSTAYNGEYGLNLSVPPVSSGTASCEEVVALDLGGLPFSSLSSSCDEDGGWTSPADQMNCDWENTEGCREEELYASPMGTENPTAFSNNNYCIFSP